MPMNAIRSRPAPGGRRNGRRAKSERREKGGGAPGGAAGRSERIRTSDPLLPKQVRYQAALHSDRGAGLAKPPGECKGGERGAAYGASSSWVRIPSTMLARGVVPVSGRPLVSETGRLAEARPSRNRM